MGEVGTRRWAARRGADVIVQSRRGAGMSRVRRAASASEDGRGRVLQLQRCGNSSSYPSMVAVARMACACVHACLLVSLLVRSLACCCATMFYRENKFYLSEGNRDVTKT